MSAITGIDVQEDGTLDVTVEPKQRVCVLDEESMAVVEYTQANEDGTVMLPPETAGMTVRVVEI